MYILIIAFMLQAAPQKSLTIPAAPPTIKRPPSEPFVPPPNIRHAATDTTPDIDRFADAQIHAQIERDIGGQAEAIGELRTRVSTLQDNREKKDRPDIDDLQLSRTHFLWIISMITVVLGTLLALYERYKTIIWNEVLIPRLRRRLSEPEPHISTDT